MPRRHKKIIDVTSAIILLSLIMLDVTMWKNMIMSVVVATAPRIYFLPVTHGESALLVLPGDVTVLTDAGSDSAVVDDLQKIVPPGDGSYIDLAIISYPQVADYEGYQYLLEHYNIGAFLYNGRSDDAHSVEWQQLMSAIAAKRIPLITLNAGDSIRYGTDEINILSPDTAFAHSADPVDTGIVQRVITPEFTVLLAADIGTNVEDALLARGDGAVPANRNAHADVDSAVADLRADILKAPFPGLGTAAGDAFLRAVAPRIVVIAPGVKNTPSEPTKAMLAHLASSTKATIVASGHGAFLLYNE
ncbi:MAG TPA: hypothetical protein VMR99_02875 [Candidatus Paceibacterota bacterium]|nr:hypothetical protein [Candidatus Paceibacterota bacterium]